MQAFWTLSAIRVRVRTHRWTAADIPWKPEIDRIRKNIQKLYAAYHYLPDFREITITGRMDFEQANVLEWDLPCYLHLAEPDDDDLLAFRLIFS